MAPPWGKGGPVDYSMLSQPVGPTVFGGALGVAELSEGPPGSGGRGPIYGTRCSRSRRGSFAGTSSPGLSAPPQSSLRFQGCSDSRHVTPALVTEA